MKYMLDTNICIYLINRNPGYEKITKRIVSYSSDEICISAIVAAELRFGVEQSRYRKQNEVALEEFLLPFQIVPFDNQATFHYGRIRTVLKAKGYPIGPLDILIAAHAIGLGVTLVTHNTKEFSPIPDLKLIDWTASSKSYQEDQKEREDWEHLMDEAINRPG